MKKNRIKSNSVNNSAASVAESVAASNVVAIERSKPESATANKLRAVPVDVGGCVVIPNDQAKGFNELANQHDALVKAVGIETLRYFSTINQLNSSIAQVEEKQRTTSAAIAKINGIDPDDQQIRWNVTANPWKFERIA